MSRRAPPPKNPLRRVDARILALRAFFRVAGRLAPERAARVAEAIFCRPPAHPMREREAEFLASGTPLRIPHRGIELAGWRWGDAGPTIILVHGWGSRAGRFRFFVPSLVAAGFRCLTYDAPAHGQTPGRRASIPEFAAALQDVAAFAGEVAGYVGHSMGGSAILFAQSRGAPRAPAAILAAPADPSVWATRFVHHLRIPREVGRRMDANLRRRLEVEWADLHIPSRARELAHPLLVIHDEGDHDVPVSEGEAIAAAAPRAEFVRTTGLGHRLIMRDPAVVARVTAFLAGHAR